MPASGRGKGRRCFQSLHRSQAAWQPMIIINADDWGGWRRATDAAAECYESRSITSVTAMVFMEDSERAAELARRLGINVGLHLNLDHELNGAVPPGPLAAYHGQVRRFFKRGRFAQVLYNPFLRRQFAFDVQAQLEEFHRLYGQPPSHIDGHHHLHLCANVLFGGLLPTGSKVRRSFSFVPGEKGALNRSYRRWIDRHLGRRHVLTDFFFPLSRCLDPIRRQHVGELALRHNVEVMTHPERQSEYELLKSQDFRAWIRPLQMGSYADLGWRGITG